MQQVDTCQVVARFGIGHRIDRDAVPGRLQSTWFRAEREGIYYGQCSELCGRNHAFMPIAVRVVSEAEFEDWLAKNKSSAARDGESQVAAAKD